MKSVIVVGAGHAPAAASRALRASGFDGSVLVLGAEPYLPYRRPPLSKGYPTGQMATGDLWLLTDQWCTDNDVEVRLGSPVRAVHGTQRAVELADGTMLSADALLAATGGRPRAAAERSR
jgi:3-phenylpropionate/trans-cinnamate dioxygenase ferredoxin reductase subunit